MKRFWRLFSIALIIVGILGLVLIYSPLLYHESRYAVIHYLKLPLQSPPQKTDFSLSIPSLGIEAPIITGVDPYNPAAYQSALTQGIAHAQGSALPTETGTVFLFAHSTVNLLEAVRYNAIFYLIHPLKSGDLLTLTYLDKTYSYSVTSRQIIKPTNLTSLTQFSPVNQLVLMTCWPPGTTFNRLIVTATLMNDSQINP